MLAVQHAARFPFGRQKTRLNRHCVSITHFSFEICASRVPTVVSSATLRDPSLAPRIGRRRFGKTERHGYAASLRHRIWHTPFSAIAVV